MIQLGQKVKDAVTGFTGIATSRTIWLNGCVRIGVQPPTKKNGEAQESQVFDEEQLQILTVKPLALPSDTNTAPLQRTGGERPSPKNRVDPR